MEPSSKRTNSDYVTKAGEEMQDFLDKFETRKTELTQQESIKNTLEQLEQDVTSIKTSLEKKKPKVTLTEVNDKVDMILEILRSWST